MWGILKKSIQGFIIGVGAILPGVSGGVMAVSMGLYAGMIEAVSHFFGNPRKHFAFLWPIALGGFAGVWATTGVLRWGLARFEDQLIFLFMGFVAGGIPDLIRETKGRGRYKFGYLVAAFMGASAMVGVWLANAAMPAQYTVQGIGPWQAGIAGGIMSAGTIIPGISNSFILMYLGWYEPVMSAIHRLDMQILPYLALGFLAVSLGIIKAVNAAFSKHPGYAYSAVTGFTIASMALICPTGTQLLWLNLLLMATGAALALLMARWGRAKQID